MAGLLPPSGGSPNCSKLVRFKDFFLLSFFNQWLLNRGVLKKDIFDFVKIIESVITGFLQILYFILCFVSHRNPLTWPAQRP